MLYMSQLYVTTWDNYSDIPLNRVRPSASVPLLNRVQPFSSLSSAGYGVYCLGAKKRILELDVLR